MEVFLGVWLLFIAGWGMCYAVYGLCSMIWSAIQEVASAIGCGRANAVLKEQRRKEKQAKTDEERKADVALGNKMYFLMSKHIFEDRLSKAEFDDLQKEALSPNLAVEKYEDRARQIRELMDVHRQELSPQKSLPAAQRADARRMLTRYWEDNEEILSLRYPRLLLETRLRRDLGEHVVPEECWENAYKLISHLRMIVGKEIVRRRREVSRGHTTSQRRQHIEHEIQDCERRIEALRQSLAVPSPSLSRDLVEEEILGEMATIRNLRRQLNASEAER